MLSLLYILVKIANFEVDTPLLIFELSIVGGLGWWLIDMSFTLKKSISNSKENRIANAHEINQVRADLIKEIAAVNGSIKHHSEEVAKDINEISRRLSDHEHMDEKKFSEISVMLTNINKETIRTSTLVEFFMKGQFKTLPPPPPQL